MKRFSFKMKLLPGNESIYKERHDAIWPEITSLLSAAGIQDYQISLDEETGILFASLKAPDESSIVTLAQQPIMQKWWQHMKDIMETNADGSPVSVPLKEVFYLP
ncbi:MAG: L-rhamnose mutarotase [Chitinophagaceae bacterium]|nr:MAG: L-rhamnose mutarotase [Chitinophagaceae bacterium]